MRPRVKICGLTRKADAHAAAVAGAWALGVIFAAESRRRVSQAEAAELFATVPADVTRIGVFVNAPLEELTAAVAACGLTALQLHGEETPEFCREVKAATGLAVIKALRVSGPQSLAGVVQFDTDYVLLDTYHPGQRGGTGRTFDWQLASGLPEEERSSRIILSGGLRPENIAEAYRAVRPYALDVSSGIETAPGKKDITSLERLFEQLSDIDK